MPAILAPDHQQSQFRMDDGVLFPDNVKTLSELLRATLGGSAASRERRSLANPS